jgi:hypothetical protein
MPIPTHDEWIKRSRVAFAPRSEALHAIDAVVEKYQEQRTAPQIEQRKTITLLLHAIKNWELTKGNPAVSKRAAAVKQLKDEATAELQRLKPPPVPPRPGWTMPPARPGPPQPGGAVSAEMRPEELQQFLREALTKHRMKARGLPSDDYELLKEELGASQFAQLCAGIMLCVPKGAANERACRCEAIRILAAMMGSNPEMASALLNKKVEVVVVPKSLGMTKLPQFYSLGGQTTFDGRTWDDVRGIGNVYQWHSIENLKRGESIRPSEMKKGRILLAITEENLTGTTDVAVGGCYSKGYSTTSHEFAHVIHAHALSKAQADAVQRAYETRQQGVVIRGTQVYYRGAVHQFNVNGPKDADVNRALDTEWVDGKRRKMDNAPQDCYAAMNVNEYFAQCVNAWLGTNAGKDPYTQRPRQNGRQWLLDNEPKMLTDVLQSLFGSTEIKNANWIVVG